MKKLIIPMMFVFASLFFMSFKSTSSYQSKMVDLRNYSLNHKEMYGYSLALKDPKWAEQNKFGSFAKAVWRNSCTALAFEVATWFASGGKANATEADYMMSVEKVAELEANNILKKL